MQPTSHVRNLSYLFKGCHPDLLLSPLGLEPPHFNFEVNHSLHKFSKTSKNIFLPFNSAVIIFCKQNCGWVWDNPTGKTQPFTELCHLTLGFMRLMFILRIHQFLRRRRNLLLFLLFPPPSNKTFFEIIKFFPTYNPNAPCCLAYA